MLINILISMGIAFMLVLFFAIVVYCIECFKDEPLKTSLIAFIVATVTVYCYLFS